LSWWRNYDEASITATIRKIRIGIDVGGTFTHAVAIESQNFSLVAQTKTSTTHHHEEGVAAGILTALLKLLQKGRIAPEEVVLVAHSTTQATNALLEGDVAKVGIIAMGSGLKRIRIRQQTQIGDLELAPGKLLRTCYRFLDPVRNFNDDVIRQTIRALQEEGAQVLVAAEAFSIDRPAREQRVVALANEMGLPATSTQQVSQLYGLRLRTRTAVINASMLPVMITTAEMIERSMRATGIAAPLMVMRSDGGIMDIQGMRERPILTMLSGPAAGIAAALMYAKVSDGIFVEVGGTSTDISVIRHGQVMMRTAQVGKHTLHTKTLDVRTVGIAGGSMPRVQNNRIVEVGPRSAHIAGMPYEAFCQIQDLEGAEPVYGAPRAGDPRDYVFMQNRDKNFAITVTGAANYLKLVPEYDYAHGGERNIERTFTKLGEEFGLEPQEAATMILDKACSRVAGVINELVESYGLNPLAVRLLGGGGGASTLLPYTSQLTKLPVELLRNNAIISAIGVALAMVRETIERSIVSPTAEDLLRIRQEAEAAVVRMGAAPETVEVKIDVDSLSHRVLAVALGSTDVRLSEQLGHPVSAHKRADVAATALATTERNVNVLADTGFFIAYATLKHTSRFFGLLQEKTRPVVIVDQHGIVRLTFKHVELEEMIVGDAADRLKHFIEVHTRYGDSGPQIPAIHLAVGPRLIDFTGLLDEKQVLSMGEIELSKFTPETPMLVLAEVKG